MGLLDRCVVGMDGSDGSSVAFMWTIAQAAASVSPEGDVGEVVAVHAFLPGAEPFSAAARARLDPLRQEQQQLLDGEWIAAAEGSRVRMTTEIIDEEPATALMMSADRHGGLPIVVGHQGHSRWSEQHIGHVAGQLLQRSSRPVVLTTAKTRPEPVRGLVVVAVHESTDRFHPPVAWATRFAMDRGLALLLVGVTSPPLAGPAHGVNRIAFEANTAAVRRADAEALASLRAEIQTAHPSLEVTSAARFGHPTDVLAASISDVDAGIVVVGNHHPRALLSFVTDGVLRNLPTRVDCPMVAVPVE